MSSLQSPDYRESFALECAPFENRPDPRFFYASTALMQRLDLLTHLTQFGESVILVAGPAGSGKTSLLASFAAHARNRWQLCLLDGNAPDQLTQQLLSALGAEQGASLQEALNRWYAQTDASELLVAVIDNAERLDQTTCNTLCELLVSPQGDRLRLVLFGTHDAQPLIKKALEQQAAPRSTQLLEVPRLSEEETASYLMYRLAVAGYSGESPFAATEVRAICKAADGRPAAVNQLAHQVLTEHMLRAKGKAPRPSPAPGKHRGSWWLAGTAGLLLLVAYLGWQRFTPLEKDSNQQQLAQAPLEQEIPLPVPEPEPEPEPASPEPVPAPEAPPAPEPVAALESQAAAAPEASADDSLPPAAALNTQDTPAVEEEAPAPVEPDTTAELAPTARAPEPADEAPTPASEQAPAPEAVATPPQPQAEPVPQPTASTDEPVPDAQSLPHREAWLLQQPVDHYSLQLLGSRSEQSINRFISRHKLEPDQTAYYRGRFKDAAWYVLMYGVYPSREAALQQIQTLPAAVRKQKPWPRDMKSVHQAIEAGRPE